MAGYRPIIRKGAAQFFASSCPWRHRNNLHEACLVSSRYEHRAPSAVSQD
jgi:hypothetical protein